MWVCVSFIGICFRGGVLHLHTVDYIALGTERRQCISGILLRSFGAIYILVAGLDGSSVRYPNLVEYTALVYVHFRWREQESPSKPRGHDAGCCYVYCHAGQ